MVEVRNYTSLLSGYFWNQPFGTVDPAAKPIILTYSFSETIARRLEGFDLDDGWFRPLSAEERQLFRTALDAWASVSGVIFIEAAPGFGDLEAGVYHLAGNTAGQANLPISRTYREGNDVHLFTEDDMLDTSQVFLDDVDGFHPIVLLHEIGHTLGLKHPHDPERTLAADLDNTANTIMSYRDIEGRETLGPLDVAAVQVLYGDASLRAAHLKSWHWDQASNTLYQVIGDQQETSGTAANDVIDGRSVVDPLIYTRGGNDSITVSGTTFQVSGGAGTDTLHVDFARAGLSRYDKAGEVQYLFSAQGDVAQASGVERIVFSDGLLAFDTDGVAGKAYRIYQAAFDRTPDKDGLIFWLEQMDRGLSLSDVAIGFTFSQEFQSLYAASNAAAYVDQLYLNVLGRSGEQAGLSYWLSELDSGRRTEAGVLVEFSESPENVSLVAQAIGEEIWLA